jgi:SH3-like domain-containing protein
MIFFLHFPTQGFGGKVTPSAARHKSDPGPNFRTRQQDAAAVGRTNMKAHIFAAGLLAWSAAMALPAAAQDGSATLEQQVEGATDTGMNGDGSKTATPQPHDPGKGAVTNLPIPRFVTLKGSQGNARRGPGLTHRIDWVFTREGMPLKVTAEYEHWRRVEDVDGAGGWIHYTLLSGVRSVLVLQDMAQAFAAPDEKSDVVYQSELGVIGKLLQCVPDWCRVAVEGEKGWVRKSALWGVDPAEIYP